ncbi:MBL fold metallo-hydrolase [Thermus caldifontis]|uniref:MBL fold metallo-hydrolase n=1 Tax=Thermus caldifontis TaxID=1930763 RepID=UPI000DF351E3|nr:MBL fold metallo-hydrolase [Thermus caldifontis]
MKRFSLGSLAVHVWGGWGEIGGNQILLEAEGGSLLLDFGKPFGRWGGHFTEFLGPRDRLGLRDLLALGLLPPIRGLYREGAGDTLFPSDLERGLLREGVDGERVLALLLSHAHLDHTGSLGYLRQDLPVVASAATAAIAKAMQDTSRVGVEGEATYLSPRALNAQGVLGGDRKAYLRRPFRLLHGGLRTFPQKSPAKTKSLEGHPWQEASSPLSLGPFRVEAFPVDHSIPGALAYAVDTPEGLVVYTGDLRRHGRWAFRTEAFLQALKGREVFLLLMEGTRLGSPGKARTEEEVRENLHRLLARHPDVPIAVDFAPRNLERLLSTLEVAEELGRRLVVTPKDAYLLWGLGEVELLWQGVLGRVLVLQEAKARQEGWEEALWKEAGARAVTLEAIAQDPGAYLLAFGFYEVNRLLDLRLLESRLGRTSKQGIYVFSNSYWADQEQILDLKVLLNWLKALDFQLHPPSLASLPPEAAEVDNPYHTSGHAPEGDLVEVVRRLRPRYLLPIHTEHPHAWREVLGKGETEVLLPEG